MPLVAVPRQGLVAPKLIAGNWQRATSGTGFALVCWRGIVGSGV